MPDDIRLSDASDEDEEFEDTEEGSERGVGESDDDFEDEDELEDVDEDDEDLDAPRGIGDDRSFTSEIGSEGGSQGDMESDRRKPRVMRGSEATTTARTDERREFDDRRAGGGVGKPRR
jgi:hypothetical protein